MELEDSADDSDRSIDTTSPLWEDGAKEEAEAALLTDGPPQRRSFELDAPQAGQPKRASSASKLATLIALVAFAGGLAAATSLHAEPASAQRAAGAAGTVVTVALWLNPGLSLGVASLSPLWIMPILGAIPAKVIAPAYFSDSICLFFGTLVLASSIEHTGLHRRIALTLLARAQGRPVPLLIAFVTASAAVSMWISNTATAAMMLPIATAVLERLENDSTATTPIPLRSAFSRAVVFGVAYGSSLGGLATLTGTGPNVVLAGTWSTAYPEGSEVLSAATWALFGVPLALVFLAVLVACLLASIASAGGGGLAGLDQLGTGAAQAMIESDIAALPPMSRRERCVAWHFASLVALWFTRPLWTGMLPEPTFVSDSTVAMFVALSLMGLPVDVGGKPVLEWQVVETLPWESMFLLGGGVALSYSWEESGLTEAFANAALRSVDGNSIVMVACVAAVLLSNLVSNVAVANIVLPPLACLSHKLSAPPLAILAPAAVACSLSFLTIIATPPNAIAFSTGRITVADYVLIGGPLTLGCAAVLAIAVWVGAFGSKNGEWAADACAG